MADAFNSDGVVGCQIIDCECSAYAFSERSSDSDPFVLRQDTTIEPLLSGFLSGARHAGLGGGLRARMAARICPKTLRGRATSASWKVMARA